MPPAKLFFLSIQNPTCAACLKTIEEKEWVKSQHPQTYHNDCFKCNDCKKTVGPKEKYFEIPSPSPRIPWIVRCSKCQENYNCHVCGGTIAVLVHKKHEGKLYHTDCWRCQSCYGTMGKTPVEANGKLFCKECADKKFDGVCCVRPLFALSSAHLCLEMQQVLSRRLHRGVGQAVAWRMSQLLQMPCCLPGWSVLRRQRRACVQELRNIDRIKCSLQVLARDR